MIDDDCGVIVGINDWQGKQKYWEKVCPIATFSTENCTQVDVGSNPAFRGGKPDTNLLSFGAAAKMVNIDLMKNSLKDI
jgi:hypothetical protein